MLVGRHCIFREEKNDTDEINDKTGGKEELTGFSHLNSANNRLAAVEVCCFIFIHDHSLHNYKALTKIYPLWDTPEMYIAYSLKS